MNKQFLIGLFILSACSSKPAYVQTSKNVDESSVQMLSSEMAPTKVETFPGRVRWVTFVVPKGWENSRLKCKDQFIKHVPYQEGFHYAYIAETYFSDKKAHSCVLKNSDKEMAVIEFQVKPFEYKAEKLKVDSRRISLSKKDQQRAAREQRMLNEIYTKSASVPYLEIVFYKKTEGFI